MVDYRLLRYCRNIIEQNFGNHPYFARFVKDDGAIDIKGFTERYQRFLSDERVSLSGIEKKILSLRVSEEGRQKTRQEIGTEIGKSNGRVWQIEERALRKLRRPQYRRVLDEIYVQDFESAVKQGSKLRGFDEDYINRVRPQLEAQTRVEEERARHEAYLAEHGIENLGLSKQVYTPLVKAGIRYIEQLEAMNDTELFRFRNIGQGALHEIRERLEAFRPGYKKKPEPAVVGRLRHKPNVRLWYQNEQVPPVTSANITNLGLSVRILNSLFRFGINTIDQLQERSDEELLEISNLSTKSLQEIREKLKAYQKQKKTES